MEIDCFFCYKNEIMLDLHGETNVDYVQLRYKKERNFRYIHYVVYIHPLW